MRLLNVHTWELRTFYGDRIPRYAILSHTWLQEHEEVTFAHLQSKEQQWRRLPGARKLELTCQQSREDGYSWAWIDTCCIDKTNSSELSEAINSMFKWYQMATVCYVFLADVDSTQGSDMLRSRWWTRAWTLQELLAPETVQFFDMKWQFIGTKAGKADEIADATNIDSVSLRMPDKIYRKSVAQRMSWAAGREATRAEDIAYALLGLFQVNMTMQYGEGERAYMRLQREIMHTTDDTTIFAWGLTLLPPEEVLALARSEYESRLGYSCVVPENILGVSDSGIFAPHPSSFEACKDVRFYHRSIGNTHVSEQHGHLTLHAPMTRIGRTFSDQYLRACQLALLPCGIPGKPHMLLAILLNLYGPRSTRIIFKGSLPSATFLVGTHTIFKAVNESMGVSPWSTYRQFIYGDRTTSHCQQLSVRSKTKKLSGLKIFGESNWIVMDEKPYINFIVETNHQLAVAPRLAVLRYATDVPEQYLYIFVETGFQEHDKIATLQTELRVHKTKNLLDMSKPLDWFGRRTAIKIRPEEPYLELDIHTRRVYNQDISILTIIEHSERWQPGKGLNLRPLNFFHKHKEIG